MLYEVITVRNRSLPGIRPGAGSVARTSTGVDVPAPPAGRGCSGPAVPIHPGRWRAATPVITSYSIHYTKLYERWLREGKTTWEISRILGIAERTVKFHVANLCLRLNANNRLHVLARARQLDLLH